MESRLVAVSQKANRQVFWEKLSWVCCCPCGLCLCYGHALTLQRKYQSVNKVVQYYTKDVLNLIAPLIHTQHKIFIQALTDVETQSGKVCRDMTLLDAICSHDVLASIIIKGKHPMKDDENELRFLQAVFARYKELEGNECVVLYGLPEYICQVSDPTHIDAILVYDQVADANSQLSRFLQRYKSSVFPE